VNSPELEKEDHAKRDETDHMHLKNIEIISAKSPRCQIWHGFLTKEECDEIIDMARGTLEESMVVGANGSAVKSRARSSSGTWALNPRHRALIKASKQGADWSHLAESQRESFYVIRYLAGEEYRPHYDSFDETEEGKKYSGPTGNRVATLLIYLHTPIQGGETIFPRNGHPDGPLEVKAQAGDAILFWDYTTEFHLDKYSLHGGKPVIEGEKWSMTGWIRMGKDNY